MTGTLALTVGLAVLIGVALGLLGGGGSILAVPLLVYVADLPAKEAISTSLLVVGATSAVGVLPHVRAHRVRWRTGLVFGLAGMTGAYVGGRLAEFVPAGVLLTGFALMMLATAVAMIRGRRPVEGRPVPHELPALRVIVDGVVVGLVTGLVGAGGGFLVVPALALLGGLPMPVAVGTSLVVVAMKSFAGLAGYLSSVSIDWGLAAAVTAAAVAGSLVGGRLAGRIPADVLRRSFGWFVVVMGVFVLARELPVGWALGLVAVAALAVTGTVAVMFWGHRTEGHSGQPRVGHPVRQRAGTGVER
ncbi:sulfite exporter TauE/SafE family protein [Micromonospora mangrovi]|uniref:Probable membrane transporter protein n=2 Tax=Micromonospora TaxID=1873 RepID=A0AAU7MBI5_9ACTN